MDLTKSYEEFVFNRMQELVANLASRWHDEKEYEDINDYKAALQKEADKYSVKILSVQKRPFGFTWQTKDKKFLTKCTLTKMTCQEVV